MYSYKEMLEDNNIVVEGFCVKAFDRRNVPFVTLTSGGVKGPTENIPVLFSSQETAAKTFEDALLAWLNGRRRVTFRMAPEMREATYRQENLHDEFSTYTYYYVACRLTAI